MIIIKDLTKVFFRKTSGKRWKKEKIVALDHVNLRIQEGEIFGLIGPNGAGKTTMIKILSTLILPEEGKITAYNMDLLKTPDAVRRNIGVLAGEFTRSLSWRLSGKNNLKFFAKLQNVPNADQRIEKLLTLLKLKEWEDELFMKYSTGMKHKLALAVALLNDPKILLLDEPLSGVDPVSAFEIKSLIRNEFKDKTIVWTSHNLYEIEEMCDRIALINRGKIMMEGSPENLMKAHWEREKIFLSCSDPAAFSHLGKIEGDSAIIETSNLTQELSNIMDIAKRKKIEIKDVKIMKPTLEDVFMESVRNA
jgi:ABC-2 type transport system ATP-binding protein